MPWRKPVASSTARGYDKHHQRARTQAAMYHHPTDPCSLCGHPLGPMGPWLHWDHNKQRDGYRGFAHGQIPCPVCGLKCNLSDGAIQAGIAWAIAKGKTPPKVTSTKINTASRW